MNNKIVVFDKAAKKKIAKMLGYKNIDLDKVVGFNKEGPIYSVLDVMLEEK